MLKLAPILEEVPEDICMSGHQGSGGHDRKLHQALPFHVGGGIGPESITRKSEMANHNSRVNREVLAFFADILLDLALLCGLCVCDANSMPEIFISVSRFAY